MSQTSILPITLTYQHLQKMQQEIANLLNKISSSFPNISDYARLLNTKIRMSQLMLENEVFEPKSKGRGGNNTAENTKKMFMALLKKHLPSDIFNQFMSHCVSRFHLKSQKENLVIFFLFLHKFMLEEKIENELIQKLNQETKVKIEKYMNNSRLKLEDQNEKRRDFHEKNIREFEKMSALNLDFSQKRSFKDLCENISILFLRKKKEFIKASNKLRSIILSEPLLKNLFDDIEQKIQEGNEQTSPDLKCQNQLTPLKFCQTSLFSINEDKNSEEQKNQIYGQDEMQEQIIYEYSEE